MHDTKYTKFFRSYQKGNAELACLTYCQTYGPMTQEEKLFNIQSSDEQLKGQDWSVEPYRRINAYANDMRIWFICCQWLKYGIFTEHTCVYYQRKYQDGEQDIQVTTEIANKFDSRLYGYAGVDPTFRFIFWPKELDKNKLLGIQTTTNYKLHQWSYLPALLSDIRVWPLRYDLLSKERNECGNNSNSCQCVTDSW